MASYTTDQTVRGNGPHAILCIPGALGTALTDFLSQLEYFGREGSEFTIVGMDPLGYGASRPPERKFLVEPDHFLKIDALDGHALLQALSFKKFSVLGWSMEVCLQLFWLPSFLNQCRSWSFGA